MKYPRPKARCKEETIVDGRWRARRQRGGQFVYGFLVKVGHRVDGILNEKSWYKQDVKDDNWPYYSELAWIVPSTLELWDEDKPAEYSSAEELEMLIKKDPTYSL